MLTRSIIGGVIVGFLLQFAEQGVLLATALIGQLVPALRGLVNFYLFTPSHNLSNIGSYAQYDTPFAIHLGPDLVVGPHPLGVSLLIVLVTWLFRRQDILG